MTQAMPPLIAELVWRGQRLRVNFAAAVPIAIPLLPNGPQPAFFAPAPMSASALQLDGFTGDVRRGGSCNVAVLGWAPHCHGTHTECVGHILAESVFVLDTIEQSPCLAKLITLAVLPGDSVISLQNIQLALPDGLEKYAALIIRTLPNPKSKQSRNYAIEPDYPVLGPDAIQLLSTSGLRHLLLDTPSLDAADNATLSNHRVWWGLEGADHDHRSTAGSRSLTEMIFVPDSLSDGDYWLELQLSPLQSDASPSRPLLYPVEFPDRD